MKERKMKVQLKQQLEVEFNNSQFRNWDEFLLYKLEQQKDENEHFHDICNVMKQERNKLQHFFVEIDAAYQNRLIKEEELICILGLALKRFKGEC